MTVSKLPQALPIVLASSADKSYPRLRILVADDDAAIRQFNTKALTCSGYHVDTAVDGAAAWAALQGHNYYLVVTDNAMPRLTGIELIEKLQTACIPLPVIMATGAMPDQEFTRHKQLQPAKTLLKPYTTYELLAAVKEVLYAAHAPLGDLAPPPNRQTQPMRSNDLQL